MRVGILARKSTSKQETSVERQIADARAFAASKGWTVVESCVFYVPEGISGAVTDRPELAALLEAGKKGLISAVIVQTNDRVTRLMGETFSMIVSLSEHGVATWSYSTGQEYSTESSTDRFMLAVNGFVAEQERERLIARTSESLFWRARQGFVTGNRLFGYDNVDYLMGDKTLRMRRPNEEEAKWVLWIFERFADGWGHTRIAEELNRLGVPSPSADRKERRYVAESGPGAAGRIARKDPASWSGNTVRHILHNESYRGVLVYGRTQNRIIGGKKRVVRTPGRAERVDAQHLRIIPVELEARVDALLARSAAAPRQGRTPKGVLVGNLLCASCGGRMYVLGTNPPAYACGTRHQKGDAVCGNDRRRPREALDDAFVDALAARLEDGAVIDLAVEAVRRRADPAVRVDVCTPLTERRDALRAERDNLERALARATPALLDRLLALLEAKQAELDAAEAALCEATAGPAPLDADALDADALRARVTDRVHHLRATFSADVPAARNTLRQLLDGPARAVPVTVNGAPRYLVRARIFADPAVHRTADRNYGGDPNGI